MNTVEGRWHGPPALPLGKVEKVGSVTTGSGWAALPYPTLALAGVAHASPPSPRPHPRCPVTIGTGSPDRDPRACAGGRRGRHRDAPRGRSSGARGSSVFGSRKSVPVTGGGGNGGERVLVAQVSSGLGREGRSGRVPGAGTRGRGEGATGHLAESVLGSAVFGQRWRRPLLRGLRAPPGSPRGPGRKFAPAARPACDPVGFMVPPGTGARGEGVGGRREVGGVRDSPEARSAATPSAAASARTRRSGRSRPFLFLLAEIPRHRRRKSGWLWLVTVLCVPWTVPSHLPGWLNRTALDLEGGRRCLSVEWAEP